MDEEDKPIVFAILIEVGVQFSQRSKERSLNGCHVRPHVFLVEIQALGVCLDNDNLAREFEYILDRFEGISESEHSDEVDRQEWNHVFDRFRQHSDHPPVRRCRISQVQQAARPDEQGWPSIESPEVGLVYVVNIGDVQNDRKWSQQVEHSRRVFEVIPSSAYGSTKLNTDQVDCTCRERISAEGVPIFHATFVCKIDKHYVGPKSEDKELEKHRCTDAKQTQFPPPVFLFADNNLHTLQAK